MVAGTRVVAIETEKGQQSQNRFLGENVVKVPGRVQSRDNHSSIGCRRDSDLVKPLPTLRLSKRQRRGSRRDIST